MIRQSFQRLALILFGIYLAVFPGSTLTVALDRVPGWGDWMGGALLMLQGAAVLCWLLGSHGRRGAGAGLLILLLAWGVEHAGVTTGFPFGQYRYTAVLQPQLLGVVPLAIACAWLMVVVGAWQLARAKPRTENREPRIGLRDMVLGSWFLVLIRSPFVVAATLVLLLDLQIELIATKLNSYWVWADGGAYYGVPTANFVAWWLVGLGMALLVDWALKRPGAYSESGSAAAAPDANGVLGRALRFLPAYLYLLNTVMFTVIDLARGYAVAGMVGIAVLLAVGLAVLPVIRGKLAFVVVRPRGDA